jgi:hypothetical protein
VTTAHAPRLAPKRFSYKQRVLSLMAYLKCKVPYILAWKHKGLDKDRQRLEYETRKRERTKYKQDSC